MFNLNPCLQSAFNMKYRQFTQTHYCGRLKCTWRIPTSHLHCFIFILLLESAIIICYCSRQRVTLSGLDSGFPLSMTNLVRQKRSSKRESSQSRSKMPWYITLVLGHNWHYYTVPMGSNLLEY